MTPEIILLVLAFAFSLICDLVPGFRDWWAVLPKEAKRWIWLGGCALIPGVLWAVACFGGFDPFGFSWQCDADGFVKLILVIVAAYGSGQVPHSIIKSLRVGRFKE